MIDANGNLILTVTLAPMCYTYYVGYAVGTCPVDPIPVPEGKPFGAAIRPSEKLVPVQTRKIDFDAVRCAVNAQQVL
ncbi:MAG: hypothetical protein IIV94_02510, partial [Clostridiales bacterium]|nr:hypothetical protein [Clostridiales bacterium]